MVLRALPEWLGDGPCQIVREDAVVARLAEQRHRARRLRAWNALGALGERPQVAAGENREVAAVRAVTSVSRYITFTASGRLVSVTRMALLRFAAVGVDVAGEHVGRGADDRLAHRELDVRAHQIEDQVEDAGRSIRSMKAWW